MWGGGGGGEGGEGGGGGGGGGGGSQPSKFAMRTFRDKRTIGSPYFSHKLEKQLVNPALSRAGGQASKADASFHSETSSVSRSFVRNAR